MASEGFENFQAVVTSLAAVGAGLVAWMGLHTWKTQIVWSADREIARTTLKLLRMLEKEIRIARHPVFFANELNETRSQHEFLAEHKASDAPVLEQAHSDRLSKVADIIDDCEAAFDECYALWGELLETDWHTTKRLLHEYFSIVDQHLFLEPTYKMFSDPSIFGDDGERKRIHAVVFASPQSYDENDFSIRLRAVFDPQVSILRAKVGRP